MTHAFMPPRYLWGVGVIALAAAAPLAAQESTSADGLDLTGAVARAQRTHPAVGAARAGRDAASAALGQARSDWWPQLVTRANVVGHNEPMLVAPIHGFEQFERIEFEKTLIQGDVSLGWTLFDGGARVNRIRGARAQTAGAAAGVRAAEMALTTRVAVDYLEVLSARGVLDAQETRIRALEAERRRVQQFLAEGQAARVELLRVDAALAEAEAERIAVAARLDRAERELARLIELPVSRTRADQLAAVALSESVRLPPRDSLIERALASNPELQRARQNVRSAEANRRVASASWFPRLEVSGSYQAFSSTAGSISDLWRLGLGVSWPIFTGGDRMGAIARAGARTELAREELRMARLQIEDAVDRALSSALETRSLVAALGQAVQHQTEVVRIERLSLAAGAGTQTDYLRAEADLSRARSRFVQARHAEIAARVELARVVGELTPEWLASNLESRR